MGSARKLGPYFIGSGIMDEIKDEIKDGVRGATAGSWSARVPPG